MSPSVIRSLIGSTSVAACLLLAPGVGADINPWIAAELYDPGKWDTAGPQTATPWLHPFGWTPGQEWGVLSGRLGSATAFTGSWGGLRDDLVKQGFSFVAAYKGQPMWNTGGVDEGSSYLGNLHLGAYFDLQRLVDWNGGFFKIAADWKGGDKGLTPDYIGNEFPVQTSTGPNATRLLHLAFGQQLFDNNAELAVGRIVTGEDFATIRLACTSLNQAICGNPIAGNRSISFPTYPFAVWGGRLKIQPGSDWYAQVGTYLVYPNFRDRDHHGVYFGAPSGSGMLTLGEYGKMVGSRAGESGLPGIYKLGGYYDGERVTEQATGEPVWGTWGVYGMAQQMLYAEDEEHREGLSGWLALSYAPPDRNRMDFMAAGGLSYVGLIPGRPNDALSFISAYGQYSDDLRDRQRTLGDPTQSNEVLLELNYRVQLAPWIYLQPDIQYIVRPAGRADVDNAFAFGFALGFVL